MKREIKFRGISFYNKDWVFGGYDPYCECIWNKDQDDINIISETIGQFTGLKDKNAKDIYEGDILMYGNNGPLIVHYTENASFEVYRVDKGFGIPDLRSDMMWQFEIIGNIHENPELLNG